MASFILRRYTQQSIGDWELLYYLQMRYSNIIDLNFTTIQLWLLLTVFESESYLSSFEIEIALKIDPIPMRNSFLVQQVLYHQLITWSAVDYSKGYVFCWNYRVKPALPYEVWFSILSALQLASTLTWNAASSGAGGRQRAAFAETNKQRNIRYDQWFRGSTMIRNGISWINNAKLGLFCEIQL